MKDITKVSGSFIGGMGFETDLDGHKLITDTTADTGGKDLGPRPKKLLLSALIGCTGADVVSMLNKMKVDFKGFTIDTEAKSSTEHPKVYTDIHLIYRFTGHNLPKEKIERAIFLSQDKYCGVSAMLKNSINITYELKLNIE